MATSDDWKQPSKQPKFRFKWTTPRIILVAVIGLFVLNSIARATWGFIAEQYFEYRCESAAGEFIDRVVEDVEGVYQMRPRDPRDFFSRLRANDPPEDVFGHTTAEAISPWGLFLSGGLSGSRYAFFESEKSPAGSISKFENDIVETGEKYWRYEKVFANKEDAKHNNMSATQISELKSKYGFTWREIQTGTDELFGVVGGELIVVDLETKEEIAVRRGFLLSTRFGRKSGMCPRDKTPEITRLFVRKVLKPSISKKQR